MRNSVLVGFFYRSMYYIRGGGDATNCDRFSDRIIFF